MVIQEARAVVSVSFDQLEVYVVSNWIKFVSSGIQCPKYLFLLEVYVLVGQLLFRLSE